MWSDWFICHFSWAGRSCCGTLMHLSWALRCLYAGYCRMQKSFTQFKSCVISGRGVAGPDPCGGRGMMHRALVLAAHCEVCWVLPLLPRGAVQGSTGLPQPCCSFSSMMGFCVKELQVPAFKPCWWVVLEVILISWGLHITPVELRVALCLFL